MPKLITSCSDLSLACKGEDVTEFVLKDHVFTTVSHINLALETLGMSHTFYAVLKEGELIFFSDLKGMLPNPETEAPDHVIKVSGKIVEFSSKTLGKETYDGEKCLLSLQSLQRTIKSHCRSELGI